MKLKITKRHPKLNYGGGLMFIFFGLIGLYGIFTSKINTLFGIIAMAIAIVFFIGGGFWLIKDVGKEYTDEIECERYEVIE